jgi:hypothetical protein
LLHATTYEDTLARDLETFKSYITFKSGSVCQENIYARFLRSSTNVVILGAKQIDEGEECEYEYGSGQQRFTVCSCRERLGDFNLPRKGPMSDRQTILYSRYFLPFKPIFSHCKHQKFSQRNSNHQNSSSVLA